MNPDPVVWADLADGCSRCSATTDRYVCPYWARSKRLCPVCCQELNQLYDLGIWPEETP